MNSGATVKHKTWTPRKEDLAAEWFVVDATGLALGRLASSVARILKGKHKPTYTPHLNTGDHVIVINAARVRVTGAKLDAKTYQRYSGYPGGLSARSLRDTLEQDPTFPIYNAVRGMLQRNTLGADMLKRLRVYAGAEHGQAAQKPKPITFDQRGDMKLGG
jgi:large subunit ribosomal protein L13